MAANVINRLPRLRGEELAKPDALQRFQDNVGQTLDPIANAVAQTPLVGHAPAWLFPTFADVNWSNALQKFTAPPLIGTSAVLAFHKDVLGYVHFKGLVTSASNRTGNSLMFTLPVGYAPKEVLTFNCFSTTGTANDATVIIFPTGAVTCGTITSGKSVDLSCIVFLAEGGGSGGLGGGSGSGGNIGPSPHG